MPLCNSNECTYRGKSLAFQILLANSNWGAIVGRVWRGSTRLKITWVQQSPYHTAHKSTKERMLSLPSTSNFELRREAPLFRMQSRILSFALVSFACSTVNTTIYHLLIATSQLPTFQNNSVPFVGGTNTIEAQLRCSVKSYILVKVDSIQRVNVIIY